MTQEQSRLDDSVARWETQLRKGVLELVILLTLREREKYGFELISGIAKRSSLELSEGTIYPLLLRLAKDDLIESRLAQGDGGAPRKYYSVTPHGRRMLDAMTAGWTKLVASVDALTAPETDR
ncbi:PadR family transcriptional regulator [Novosphingobium sediminis]|uniref:PadR family transcriptional regulator n=1 Tax=Novosphingobium sediminis TaxID=707214 RepID=A0A512ANI6_9SPHN|nr:PadR family transcriptional regulator [Novosphingobium sediminis]GEO01157.1 PadR family transcriptional regulator [Novosphingobium sediminis]